MTPLHISNKQYEYFLSNFENLKHRKKYVNLYKNIYDGKRYMIRENYKETLDDKNQLIHIIETFKNVNIYLSREIIQKYSTLGLTHYLKRKHNYDYTINLSIKDVMKTKQKYDWAKYYIISVLGLIEPVDL